MKVIDPVCKMEVETESTENKKEHKRKTYHFCTPLCMVTFEQEPEKYAQSKKPYGNK